MFLTSWVSELQEKTEQHSEAYILYDERAAEVLPQQGATSLHSTLSFTQGQVQATRRQK